MNQSDTHSHAAASGPPERARPWWHSWPWWVAAAAVTLLVLMAGVGTDEAPTMWRHLSTGRYIAESGLPKHDPFTALGANRAWANPSWLFDLTLYFAYLVGGTTGLILLRFLLAAAVSLVLWLPARRAGGSALAMPALMAVLALQSALNLSPMLPGMIIVGMFAVTLDRWERQRSISALCWLAGIQVLWANTSSTFILGPLVAMLRWIGATIDTDGEKGDKFRQIGLIPFFATGVASCVTPFGAAALRSSWADCFAAFAISADGQALVPGLAPLWSIAWPSPSSIAFVILVAAALLAGILPTLRFRALFATLFLSVLAVADTRQLPLVAVWLVITTQQSWSVALCHQPVMEPATRQAGHGRWLMRAASLSAAGWVGLTLAGPARDGLHRIERQARGTLPVEPRRRWLSQGEITGAVLLFEPASAGWLVWGNPTLRPLLDDRCELFAGTYSTYRRLCLDVAQDRHNTYRRTDGSLGGWRQFANAVPFEWIVSRSSDAETNLMLNSSVFWGPVYWDADVVIFGHEQNERVAAAAQRLESLKSLNTRGVDHSRELHPDRGESLLILDNQSWTNYTPREFVDLARVYYSLDLPKIAQYLITRLDDPSVYRETDDWLRRFNQRTGGRTLELQDSPR